MTDSPPPPSGPPPSPPDPDPGAGRPVPQRPWPQYASPWPATPGQPGPGWPGIPTGPVPRRAPQAGPPDGPPEHPPGWPPGQMPRRRGRPVRTMQSIAVQVTLHLPDGTETTPIDLVPGTPIPQTGDTVALWDDAGQQERTAGRVTERVLSYFPGPAGTTFCEVLLYTESA